jgi:class 3 adenylate cyclase
MLLAVGALGVTLVVGWIVRSDITRESLDARFAAASTAKADEVSRYVKFLEDGALGLAVSSTTADAARQLSSAYRDLPRADSLPQEQTDLLLDAYRDEYMPLLSEAMAKPIDARAVIPATDPAIYLQTVYNWKAIQNGLPPADIDDAEDGSSWSEIHAEFNPTFQAAALSLGMADILLIDPATASIVYSAAKLSDFGTNLRVGPVSGTFVATLYNQIMDDPQPGAVTMVDFSRYNPDLGAPVAFLGTPVYDGAELVSVLVAKVDSKKLSSITTQSGDWDAMRLGTSGEVFIVGSDGLLRTDSRQFLENPAAYFQAAQDAGTLSPDAVPGVKSADTTTLFQSMDASTLRAIEAAPGDMVDSTNYLGSDVFTSLSLVDAASPGWNVVVQVQRDDALAISNNVERLGATSVAIFVLILTFVAVWWSASFIRPIVVLSERLRSLVQGSEDSKHAADLNKEQTRTTVEFSELTDTIDEMLASLDERERSADAAEAERIAIVRQFLPEDAARQIQTGERNIENVAHASVVVAVIDDTEALGTGSPLAGQKSRFETIVRTLDQMARDHGLRRVKVVGDRWIAVCGLDTPYVDHVARSVGLAADAAGLQGDAEAQTDGLTISVGVSAGPVSAGLAGSDRLVYDAWGSTVTEAVDLARTAKAGEVVVSASVIDRLPPGIPAKERTLGATGHKAWTIEPDEAAAGVPT